MVGKGMRRWLAAVAAAGFVWSSPGLMAGAATSTGQADLKAQTAKISRITAAVQMTKDDPVPSRTFSSPVMLADPSNPRIVVAAMAELRTGVCYLARSADAGRTWHILPALPALGSYPDCTTTFGGDVVAPLAWGRNNTLYYALEGYGTVDGGNSRQSNFSVLLARSTNLGNSWSTSIVDNSRGLTGPAVTFNAPVTSVAVDSSGAKDVVYVGWGQDHPRAPKMTPASDSATMVGVSTDGGQSFAPPVNINSFAHVSVTVKDTSYPLIMSAPFLAVGKGGVLEAMSGPRTPSGTNIPGPPAAQPVLVARSTDQGRTWSVADMGPPVFTPRGPVLEANLKWDPLGGPQGSFVAVYAAFPADAVGPADIEFQRSTDGGNTWSTPVILNDDNLSKQFLHFLPTLNVAPNGRIDVAWYDFRGQHAFAPDVYYTYSANDGRTWAPNVKVTDQPINFSIGVSANSDVRQPPGVASANQYAAFGWADTRLGNDVTQTQDVFGDAAQYAPLPASGSTALPILAAFFAGLVILGAIFIGIVMNRRRKESPPPPRVEERQPVASG